MKRDIVQIVEIQYNNNAGEVEVLTGLCRQLIEFEQSRASSCFTGSMFSLIERVFTGVC